MNRFWEKPLQDLTPEEWEALCDGCALCCLYKLIDEDTDQVEYTRVVCRYLDLKRCQCSIYDQRQVKRPDCLNIVPDHLAFPGLMPKTCAYLLASQGKPLPAWHPLLTGDPASPVKAGVAASQVAISQDQADLDNLEDYILDNPVN